MTDRLPTSAIRVGQRHRREFGDLDELARGIDELGLLQAIGVTPDGELIFGERRLRAWALSRRKDEPIPVTVHDIDVLAGEAAENMMRKNPTPSEAVAMARMLRPRVEAAARERQGTRTDLEHGGKFPPSQTGKVRDLVAKKVGLSSKTLEKAEELVTAAEAEPDRFGKLIADMDRTGKVNGPFKRLVVAREAERIRADPPPLPGRGPYRVIAVDLPWAYEKRQEDPSHRGILGYATMSLAEMCALDVPSIAAEDCVLWLWVTNHHLEEAFVVLKAWGFRQVTNLTWVKDKMGHGDWLRGQTEQCLMCVRGKPIVTLANHTTVLHAPTRGHSWKPLAFYPFVESLCPAPRYAELFARERRPRWDAHGAGLEPLTAEEEARLAAELAEEEIAA